MEFNEVIKKDIAYKIKFTASNNQILIENINKYIRWFKFKKKN